VPFFGLITLLESSSLFLIETSFKFLSVLLAFLKDFLSFDLLYSICLLNSDFDFSLPID
jgi:hypothetical protein